MNPPTEQLIRDYLNRVSVAARGKLGSVERREFLARMRESIERLTGPPETAELIEVGKILSGLGEPRALVEQERARLAQSPGGPGPAAPRSGPRAARPPGWISRISSRRSAEPWARNGVEHPDIPSAGVSGPEPGPQPRGEPGPQPGAEPGPQPRGEPGPQPGAEPGPQPRGEPGPQDRRLKSAPNGVSRSQGSSARNGSARNGSAQNGSAGSGSAGSGSAQGGSAQGGSASTGPASTGPAPSGPAPSGSDRNGSSGGPKPADGPPGPAPGDPPASSQTRHWPFGPGAQAERATRTARLRAGLTSAAPADGSAWLRSARAFLGSLARAAVALARRRPLEACAIVLLGLGGLVYPPVWLLGAFIALMSRDWDFRDKWIGLAGPVLLMIVGTVLLVAQGGHRASVHLYLREAWMLADYLSRAGAVLGAAYLTWRVQRGRREPPVPPWNRPQRSQDPQRPHRPPGPHRS